MTSPVDPSHITHVLNYAAQYRDAVIVVKIEDDERLSEIISELILLRKLGMRMLCVINFSHHFRQLPEISFQAGLPIIHLLRSDQTVTYSPALISRVKKVQALITATPQLSLVSAQTIQCVVHQIVPTGQRLEVIGINQQVIDPLLSKHRIPVWLSIDQSPSRLIYSAEELAGVIANTYQASKLIFCAHQGGIFINHRLQRQLTPEQLTALIPELSGQMHAAASIALKVAGQVPRVHLVPQQRHAILYEIFTEDGFGTLVYNDQYHAIRPANSEDLPAIQLLHQQWSRPTVQFTSDDLQLKQVWVATREASILGVAYLHGKRDQQAEVTLLIDRGHTGQGFGKQLLHAISQLAETNNINQLLVLTTIAKEWYVRQGFVEQSSHGQYTRLTKQLS